MSNQITTAFVQQYSSNVQMLSQQMGSLLRGAVDVESVVGKNAFFDQVGKTTAVLRASRHADTPQIDTPHSRRRVSLADYEWADLIDNADKVRLLIDPTSSYAKAAAAAMGRAMDDVVIAALGGLKELLDRKPLIQAGHKLPDPFYWDLWGNLEHLIESYQEHLAEDLFGPLVMRKKKERRIGV